MHHGQSTISVQSLRSLGHGLKRPECALAHSSGYVFTPDWRGSGGISAIAPNGDVAFLGAKNPPRPLRPNGIALEPDGCFLLADLGETLGGVWRLHPDGAVEPVLTQIGSQPLPPTNFVLRDAQGRLWITVSTRKVPRDLGYRRDVADGFIVLVDRGSARIVADNLGYANECLLSADERHLYVNETFARRLSRFSVLQGTGLGPRETVAEFAEGVFPDGLALDADGGIWITSIVSNRVLRIDRAGRMEVVIEDCAADHVAWVEQAYTAGTLGRPHLDRAAGKRLRNISNLAFGGAGLRTGYLGCLLGDALFTFDSPVAGHPPSHWGVPLGALAPAIANQLLPRSGASS